MFAQHHEFVMLIETFHQFSYQAVFRFFMFLFVFDSNVHPDCIINKNGFDKAEPLIPVGNGYFIDKISGQSDRHSKDEGAMGNPAAKRLGLAPFFVHMMGEKVARLSRVDHDIGFGDRPAPGLSGMIQFEFLEVLLYEHGVAIVAVCAGKGAGQGPFVSDRVVVTKGWPFLLAAYA